MTCTCTGQRQRAYNLFGLAGKLEIARWLANIDTMDTQALQHVTVHQWLECNVRQPDARRLLAMFLRVATYANDVERQSAGAALAQVQLALAGNVWYVDGGWQTLVNGLHAVASQAGVEIITGVKVTTIEHDGQVRRVRLADGTRCAALAVIVAGRPADASALVEDGEHTLLATWTQAHQSSIAW